MDVNKSTPAVVSKGGTRVKKPRRVSYRVIAGTLLALLLPAGTLAYAQTSVAESANPETGLPTITNLSSSTTQENASTATSATNPYGCSGRSDTPHASHHIPGNITAQVTTQCDVAMPNITAYGDLERALGLGFTRTVATAYVSKNGKSYVHANPGAPFPVQYNSLYLIYGTSTATDASGTQYIGYTSNQAWVSP